MSAILNIAILGCGRVAGHHIRAINSNPQLKLSALSDLNLDRCLKMPGAGSVPHYANYHEMLQNHPEIDVVSIITPSGMHFEHAMDVIQTYNKSLVIEKPVVMRILDGEILAQTALAQGVKVFPVHQYRFNRCVQRIRHAVMDKELGNIVLATVRMRWCRPQHYYDRDPWRGTFALDGGCCTNQGIHHLDLLRYLAGEVKRVNAIMRTIGSNIEVEDTAVVTLEFKSGALGVFEITTAARPNDFESSFSIVGDKGLAMLGGWATDKLITFSPKPEEEAIYSDSFEDAYGYGHNEIYGGVYNALVHGGQAAVELDDAQHTIQLLHAIYLSAERQSWVDVAHGEESALLGKPDDALASLYRTLDQSTTIYSK